MYALTSCWGSPGERPGWRYCSSQLTLGAVQEVTNGNRPVKYILPESPGSPKLCVKKSYGEKDATFRGDVSSGGNVPGKPDHPESLLRRTGYIAGGLELLAGQIPA
jgi:hypothetical protein